MRVALFGGTFDPPHLAHLAIAAEAATRFSLQTVFFAPAARQPLKSALPGAPYSHRLTMVALACAADPRFAVSNLDAPRPDGEPNFTVDTLATLAELLPHATLFNIVGADSFRDLPRWREPRRLLALAEWIVLSRPGVPLPPAVHPDPPGLDLTPSERARIHLLDTVHLDLASTRLRERLAAGDPCTESLPRTVAAYIAAHKLYREVAPASPPTELSNPLP